MAKFRLSLIRTEYTTDQDSKRIATVATDTISDFINHIVQDSITDNIDRRSRYTYTLSQKDSFTYTYNEKFTTHQNAQKTLTFSMDKTITRDDRLEENPFIRNISVGTQLLLQDKYDNQYLMTVNKINYHFNSLNVTYDYECQDSFSYQLARQNTGYTIKNDIESEDFLGAHTIDWWVLRKIAPDCHIGYTYSRLEEDLIIDNVIIKHGIKSIDHPSFFTSVPFSDSGTADSLLISLGNIWELQLAVYEHLNEEEHILQQYYWFEPKKNLQPSGLKYSPYHDLKSFDFSRQGNSLSTVLNVQPREIQDNFITLFPSVPEFFKRWFQSEDWQKTSYEPGMFTKVATHELYTFSWDSKENSGSRIPIPDGLFEKIPELYDFISFQFDGYISSINYLNNQNQRTIAHNTDSIWKFIAIEKKTNIEVASLYEHEKIPVGLLGKNAENYYFYVQIDVKGLKDVHGDFYINFYRNPSKEEQEFAKSADTCPWLENKLIDFSYFVNRKIISPKAYHTLKTYIENDLRKINGRFLYYSDLYYQAIRTKHEKLSELSQTIDKLGATFNAELLEPYNDHVNTRGVTNFQEIYNNFFASNKKATPLIDYQKTLADYVDKYINTEQRFLKNIYEFQHYFESPSLIDVKRYKYTITLPEPQAPKSNIFFDDFVWKPLKDIDITDGYKERVSPEIPGVPTTFNSIYQKQGDSYELIAHDHWVNEYNYLDFFIKKPQYFQVSSQGSLYNDSFDYFKNIEETSEKVKKSFQDLCAETLQQEVGDPSQYYYIKETTPSWNTLVQRVEKMKIYNRSLPLEDLKILMESLPQSKNALLWDLTTTDHWLSVYEEFLPLDKIYYNQDALIPIEIVNNTNYSQWYRRVPSVPHGVVIDQLTDTFDTVGWTNYSIDKKVVVEPFQTFTTNEIARFYTREVDSYSKYKDKYRNLFMPEQNPIPEGKTLEDSDNVINMKNFLYTFFSLRKAVKDIDSANSDNKIKRLGEEIRYKTKEYILTQGSDHPSRFNRYYILEAKWFKETLLDSEDKAIIDSISGYPLVNLFKELPFNLQNWSTLNIIENIKRWAKEKFGTTSEVTYKNHIYTITCDNDNKMSFMLWREENNQIAITQEMVAKIEDARDLIQNHAIYKKTTIKLEDRFEPIDWKYIPKITANCIYCLKNAEFLSNKENYINPDTPDDLVKFDPNTEYYCSNGDKAYCIQKEKDNDQFFLRIHNKTTDLYTFSNIQKREMTVWVSEYDSEKNIYKEPKKEVKEIELGTPVELQTPSFNNGNFWINFKDASAPDEKVLKDKAFTIETDLTEFWNNAYRSSLYCKYFIPQYWQPSVNQKENALYKQIFIEETTNIGNKNYINLSFRPKFLPQVEVVVKEPTYNFKYYEDMEDYFKEIQLDDSLRLSNVPSETLNKVMAHNPVINSAIRYLGINPNNWIAEKSVQKQNYYQAIEGTGGSTWTDALKLFSGGQIILSDAGFGGWYDLMIKHLLQCNYVNDSCEQYYKVRQQHDDAWTWIYNTYPNILLEQNYESKTATSSADLLQEAKLAFRDYTQVEKNYNISVIDFYSLQGYKGQELRIGDSIELNAPEIYEDYDDIYNDLIQYLFITDLSYDLRDDSNITITVNDIKYQDKVIGELIKLIR